MLLFATTIFLSAFLLFLVQPVLAKQILPWFGGGALVWTLCMVFFQLVLLLGYGYAHALVRLAPRRQALVHLALLAASLGFLPMVPSPAWKPAGGDNPAVGILLLLFATVGLPYLVLSSTSPLVQSWFARSHPGASPYRLFALSNLASMLALLGYPFAIEPALANRTQSLAWSAGYAAFVACCGYLAWRSRDVPALAPEARALAGEAAAQTTPSGRARMLWLALSALGSATLLAVTNHLTQNISSIPLLWLFPLAIYLLTFILCFEGSDWYRPGLYVASLAWTLVVMAWFVGDRRLQFELVWQAVVFLVGLYFVCMFCHGELARRRPPPRYLTQFYLWVAFGGVVGGALVGLVAPVTLPGYLELDIALLGAAIAAVILHRRRRWPAVAALGAVAAFVAGAVAWHVHTFTEDTLHIERDFYGVLRVKEGQTIPGDPDTRYRALVHGAILHGEQYLGEQYRHAATTYYQVSSGIGRTLLSLSGRHLRVGVIGLGAGSLAVYASAGDVYRFYDINPAVERIAREYFTYLADAPGKVEVVLGDARLSLEREPPQRFDVLAIDAFTGDAIPVHLLTVEAVGEYLRHMRPGGVIAFHVSNRFLDLKPVLLAIAEHHHLEYAYIHEKAEDRTTSDWVLLTRDRTFLLQPRIVEATEPVAPEPGWRLWTDDFNNLLQVFRW
jgi:SAM-dependent methyltransferase